MSGDRIKVSSRTVIDLLSGRLSYENFPDSYKELFARYVSEGKLLSSASIEHVAEEDDDWLVLEFGEVDAAIFPFHG